MADLREQLQSTLGSAFTLERELGGGGMSRVFVAEETALGRKIVVKLLPHDTAAGVSTERFKREIQIAARLQHPHIVPLLSAGESGGLPFYTMPFVKGDSLRTRLSRGGELSVNEAVHILRDVAAALAYAHSEGVVHRDIKPDNVIVSGGVAVVTDFGVSKAVDIASSTGDKPGALTSLGVALGTPAYMAPEQASADPQIDHRADIYSFGCLAYELLTGTSPFAGRPLQQILAAHVTEAPDPVQKRRPNVPPALSALVMKCLEKHAGDRPQSGDDLLSALDGIATTPSGGSAPTSERLAAVKVRSWKWLMVSGGLAFAAMAFILARAQLNKAPTYTIGSTLPVATTPDLEGNPAISPDGKLVAFVAPTDKGDRIFVQQIDGGRASLLTDGIDGNHFEPKWTPDGARVSFESNGSIYVVPALTGGSPKRLIDRSNGHAWSPDGKRIAVRHDGAMWVRDVDGGAEKQVVAGQTLHSQAWSPDGRFLAYVDGNTPSLTNISVGTIWTIAVTGGTPARISDSTHVNLSPVWTPDGKSILYISNRHNSRDVYQQAMRSDGSATGEPVRLTTGLSSFVISLSADGSRMAYDVVRNNANVWSAAIAGGISTMASARQITRDNQHVESMGISRDGGWLAYDSDRGGNADIFKIRLDGGEPVQLTTNTAPEFAPDWSPDGREIAFHSNRSGSRDIFVMTADGTAEKRVTSGPDQDYYPTWSADGNQIAFVRGPGGRGGVYVSTRGPDGTWSAPRNVVPDAVRATWPRWSPTGKLLAYINAGGVMLVDPEGGPPRVLANARAVNGGVGFLTWGSDASTVYAKVYPATGPLTSIWAIPVGGGAPRKLLTDDLKHIFGRQDFATDGKRLFFTLAQWESDVYVMDIRR